MPKGEMDRRFSLKDVLDVIDDIVRRRHDVGAIRADIAKRNIEPVIPGRSNRRMNIE